MVLRVFRMGELSKSHTGKLFAAVTEQFLHGRIAEQDPAFLDIHQRYADCCSLKDCSKVLLTFPEGLLSAPLVGDVEKGYEVLLAAGSEGNYGSNLLCSASCPTHANSYSPTDPSGLVARKCLIFSISFVETNSVHFAPTIAWRGRPNNLKNSELARAIVMSWSITAIATPMFSKIVL